MEVKMKTSNDVLIGLLASKELEIKTLYERLAHLSNSISILMKENDQLYKALEEKSKPQHHEVGFKNGG